MRIAVVNLTAGGMSGGYRKYLCNVLPRVAKHHDVEAILCASPESIDVQGWFDPMPSVRFVSCKPFRFLFSRRDVALLRDLEKFKPDVIFVPVEHAFRFKNISVVNMMQNMEPFVSGIDGMYFVERFRHWAQRTGAKMATKGADKVIVVSRFVSDFLVTHWKIPITKIGLVYYGVNVRRPEDGCKSNIIPDIWHDKFIFTAGSVRPARGLEDLLLAMKNLLLQGEKSVRLVVAGESGHSMACYQKKLKDWAQKNGLSDRICWAGNLNENEMVWCYQNCSAFIMTSRVESFGMIGVEAMSHGCICVSADNPCLPELFGDAAIYYPPKDGKALAEAIQTVLTWDDVQRSEAFKRAKKRAGTFSWDICAERTVNELAKVAKR